MISFTCDYNEGAHPSILDRLSETNFIQAPGYGEDSFCIAARERIRQAIDCPQADVFFLVGGTQTNATVIDAMTRHHEGVLAVETGHVAVHEAGAVEMSGHKVITLPACQGKMEAVTLHAYLERFYADPTSEHMVQPGIVYVSHPTEYGTIYSYSELEALHDVCRTFDLPLFVDGARLAYALGSTQTDITLPQLARLCDVFYIGGTKVGALCGEAVVFPQANAPRHFFSIVKQHGALLAKGRLLGIQFDTLFTDDLYLRLGQHAVKMAARLRSHFLSNGIPFYIDSPTNQLFPILTEKQMSRLRPDFLFEVWETLADGRAVTRFATSWATTPQQVEMLTNAWTAAGI